MCGAPPAAVQVGEPHGASGERSLLGDGETAALGLGQRSIEVGVCSFPGGRR
jgi:hypothetical protein